MKTSWFFCSFSMTVDPNRRPEPHLLLVGSRVSSETCSHWNILLHRILSSVATPVHREVLEPRPTNHRGVGRATSHSQAIRVIVCVKPFTAVWRLIYNSSMRCILLQDFNVLSSFLVLMWQMNWTFSDKGLFPRLSITCDNYLYMYRYLVCYC